MDRPYRIAFVTAHMADLLSRSMWYSLQDCARTLPIRLTAVLAGNLDDPESGPRDRSIHRLLNRRNFDGALLFTGVLGQYSTPESVAEYWRGLGSLPTVSLGIPIEGITSVAIDQGAGVRALVHHLYHEHGHRRFGFVGGPGLQIEATQRKQAFFAALDELGVSGDRVVVVPGDYSKAAGVAAVRHLAGLDVRPTALVCSNDAEAFGAIEEAKRRGWAVPQDLAVTGFDDVDLASLQEPQLTTVRQPIVHQTALAVELLLSLLQGASPGDHRIEQGQLLFRGSCGCLPRPTAPVLVPRNSDELVQALLGSPGNASPGFLVFAEEWILAYTQAFEHYLETGDRSRLRTQWLRYMGFPGLDLEKGLSFRHLLTGLETLFGSHPNFEAVYRDNLYLAGEAESRKGVDLEQQTRDQFYGLHRLETALARVTTLDELANMIDPGWSDLGISAVCVFGRGVTPSVVTVAGARPCGDVGADTLPPRDPLDAPLVHRIVVSLDLDKEHLGYVIFWARYSRVSIYELLGNQFALALHRIELLERHKVQSRTLERSLDETRKMQRQLVETEKVASLGRLVAGVAHEINTPLGTGITGSSFLLERIGDLKTQLDSGTLSRSNLDQFLALGTEALEGILRNLMKAGELIQVFKGLGLDHSQGEWKPVDLSVLFADLGAVYRSALAQRGIGFHAEFPPAPTLFYTQSSALVQIVGELLENALEHAFEGDLGREPQICLQVQVEEGLRIAVTDNGRGISEDDRRHLFDPLFTTKRSQGHPGLGLHLAFQLVVHTLGGQMTVASEVDHGTCFLCLIPVKHPA